MMDIKDVLLQQFINFLIENPSCGAVKNEYMSNQRPLDLDTQEFAPELHKPIIRTFEKQKVYFYILQTIFGVLILLIRT